MNGSEVTVPVAVGSDADETSTGFTDAVLDRFDAIVFDDLPAEAVACAKECVLDVVGVALAGWSEPESTMVFDYATSAYGAGPATVLGTQHRIAPEGAALVNGTLAHAHDYDDTSWSYIGHGSAVILPAALAVGEAQGASGRELIGAFVAGLEVAALVGAPLTGDFARRGWHLTSAVGVLGAAAAAGRLLGLDRDGLARALGVAAARAGGLKASFGYMAKPYQVGLAASGGVQAARLAQSGLTACPTALEAPLGYFSAFADAQAPPSVAGPLSIVADGVAFKRYPSCTGSHPAVDGVLAIVADTGIRGADVQSIRVGTTPEVPGELVHPRPATGAQAKFSMPFAVAVALIHGDLKIEHFTDAMVTDRAIGELMDRCEVFVDADLDRPVGVRAPAASVEIVTADGRAHRRRIELARGNPGRPLSHVELVAKFRDCATRRLDEPSVTALLARAEALEHLGDVAELLAATRSTT